MRAHVLALLLLVIALLAPAGPVTGAQTTQTADAQFAQGRQLMRRGDYAPAGQLFTALADQLSPELAPEARLLAARAALADGDTDAAEAALQQILGGPATPDQTARAFFALAQVRRAAGDCTGALRALASFESMDGTAALGPYTSIWRAQCASVLGDWSVERDAARTAVSIDGGGPRLARIEAFERLAEANRQLGQDQAALDAYNQALALAGTRAYRAEMLFTTASLARTLGQDDLAAERFRSVVVDYPDQARAPGALDALDDMDGAASISFYQAGLVRLNGKQYARAVGLFDQVDEGSDDWGLAQLSRAEALLKLDDADAARQGLQAVADADPRHAGSALLRLGQLDERDSEQAAAEAHYAAMAQAAPDRAAEALYHVGFSRYVRHDLPGAQAAFAQALASGPATPDLRAQLEYWSAKTLPAGSAEANAALDRATAAAPDSYYALRAADARNGTLAVASSAPSTSAGWLAPTAQELRERSDWFAAQNTTPERAAGELAATPGLQRAVQLLDFGLRTEASWEIDDLMQQYGREGDLVHLAALGDWLAANDQPQLEVRVGRLERDLVGYTNLPRSLRKQVYPAGWGDLVQEQASRYSVDPLLMLALVRQESSFDPRAYSGAQAMGLTQVVPSTARAIAAQLGREDFATRDLFKPAVSLEFGTWFLSHLLGEYHGQIMPALAAYNAGGGNATRWLDRFGSDPDVLAESIPLAETQAYVRIVYDNYWHYQSLYAGR